MFADCFVLTLERNKFLKVGRGVTKDSIIKTFSVPIHGELKEGTIISLPSAKKYLYAAPSDTYRSLSLKLGVSEEYLRRLNADAPIYPAKRIWY